MTRRFGDYMMTDYGMIIGRFREDDSMYPFPNGEMRTKSEYPYSYDPFFAFGNRQTMEGCETVYSDRLSQYDYDKNREIIGKHFIKDRGYFHQSPSVYQAYLSDYFGYPVSLRAVAEGCNVSNGYPYLIFFFKKIEKKKKKSS